MDKEINSYIGNLLKTFSSYSLSPDDENLVKRDLVVFLTRKILAKKFRKQKLHEDTISEITTKIQNKVKENKPIYFTIPFGGYKHFWNPSHPEPDWAEVFTLRFLTDWVSPILATYKPGVIIELISEDMILPRMNNYPDKSLDTYAEAFGQLLDTYRKILPENFVIRYFRVGDKYDKRAIIAEVEKLLPDRWEKWKKYTEDEKAIELKRSKRSVMWDGREDLTGLSDDEKQKRMIESRLIELAYYDVEARPEFLGDHFTEDNRIGVCFSFGLSPDNVTHWITLGTTYASIVDYWIGRGILEVNDRKCVPRIVSKAQYQKIKDTLRTIPLQQNVLHSENYHSIEVISSDDWASAFITSL